MTHRPSIGPSISGPHSSQSILLVEDSPEDAELIRRVLKKAHIANPVDVVGDGVLALDYLRIRQSHLTRGEFPILVLLDLQLPKMDGFEVLLRMQEEVILRELPVIVVTSSQDQEDVLQSYALGVRSFVRKPVEFGPFSQAIAKLGIHWLLVAEATSQGVSPQEKAV